MKKFKEIMFSHYFFKNFKYFLVRHLFVTAAYNAAGVGNFFKINIFFNAKFSQGCWHSDFFNKVGESLNACFCKLFIGFALA